LPVVSKHNIRLDPAGGEVDAVSWTSAQNATARQLDPDSQTPAGRVEANFFRSHNSLWRNRSRRV